MKARIQLTIKLSIVVLVSYLFASDSPDAVKLIESSTAGIIGSLLGGITAGISIIFGILSTLNGKVESISTGNQHFIEFLSNLKLDIKVLVYCLIASIALPYFRVTGIPLISMPSNAYLPSRDVLYTTLEIAIITISMFALLEIISVMFRIFKLSIDDNSTETEESGQPKH